MRNVVSAQSLFGASVIDFFDSIGKDVETFVKHVAQEAEEWLEKQECQLCEDGIKAFGYMVTASLLDDDGAGEGEAAMVEVIKIAKAEFDNPVQSSAKNFIFKEYCGRMVKPISKAIAYFDSGINETSLTKCGTEVCVASIDVILSTWGQALVSQLLSQVFAVACHCPPHFEACLHIAKKGSHVGKGPAAFKEMMQKDVHDELAAALKQRRRKDKAKQVQPHLPYLRDDLVSPISSLPRLAHFRPCTRCALMFHVCHACA